MANSLSKPTSMIAAAGAWINYEASLRQSNRYVVHDPTYFDGLLRDCLACRYSMGSNWALFRARAMPVDRQDDTKPLDLKDMGMPPREKATPGRLNPEGIPCFYAALEPKTAIAEIRPWKNAAITVAKFTTKVPLDVLDLTGIKVEVQPSPSARYAGWMIGQPVNPADPLAYLGTQFLAAKIDAEGVAGIFYDSSLNEGGTNVALFSDYGLRPVEASLHKITSVSYDAISWPP